MEVEVKPRYVAPTDRASPKPDEINGPTNLVSDAMSSPQDTPNPTPLGQPGGEGFWSSVYKYKTIIIASVMFTILVCCVIYYFWQREEKSAENQSQTKQSTQSQPPTQSQQHNANVRAPQSSPARQRAHPQNGSATHSNDNQKIAEQKKRLAEIARRAKENSQRLTSNEQVEAKERIEQSDIKGSIEPVVFARDAEQPIQQNSSQMEVERDALLQVDDLLSDSAAHQSSDSRDEIFNINNSECRSSSPIREDERVEEITETELEIPGAECAVECENSQENEAEKRSLIQVDALCPFVFKNGNTCNKKTNGRARCRQHSK